MTHRATHRGPRPQLPFLLSLRTSPLPPSLAPVPVVTGAMEKMVALRGRERDLRRKPLFAEDCALVERRGKRERRE